MIEVWFLVGARGSLFPFSSFRCGGTFFCGSFDALLRVFHPSFGDDSRTKSFFDELSS